MNFLQSRHFLKFFNKVVVTGIQTFMLSVSLANIITSCTFSRPEPFKIRFNNALNQTLKWNPFYVLKLTCKSVYITFSSKSTGRGIKSVQFWKLCLDYCKKKTNRTCIIHTLDHYFHSNRAQKWFGSFKLIIDTEYKCFGPLFLPCFVLNNSINYVTKYCAKWFERDWKIITLNSISLGNRYSLVLFIIN